MNPNEMLSAEEIEDYRENGNPGVPYENFHDAVCDMALSSLDLSEIVRQPEPSCRTCHWSTLRPAKKGMLPNLVCELPEGFLMDSLVPYDFACNSFQAVATLPPYGTGADGKGGKP